MRAAHIEWDGDAGAVEASDLGLPPGRFPNVLVVETPQGEHAFVRQSVTRRGGDLVCVLYRSAGELRLTVIND